MAMQIGIVGLGRMGANVARRLMRAGHACVVFDIDRKARDALAGEGATPVTSLAAKVTALVPQPRAIWLMLPAGPITEVTPNALPGLLQVGDIIVDGGNSYYKDAIRRANSLAQKQIAFVDCGTSGGVWGPERGYCLMISGDKDTVRHLDPIFAALAPGVGSIARTPGCPAEPSRPERGYLHAGPSGAGHRQDHLFGDRLLSAMRLGFGGHVEGGEHTGAAGRSKTTGVGQRRRRGRMTHGR